MAHKTEQLKQLHKQKVKDYFYDKIKGNKIQLSEETGISKTTCTTILKELLEEHIIEQVENNESTGGRPSKQYKLNQDFWHACLVDIRNSSQIEIEIRVCNLYGQLVKASYRSMNRIDMKQLYELLDQVMKEDPKIEVITVSIPSVVRHGECIVTSDIKELEGRNLNILLGEQYEVDVLVENDVNLAVVGYHKNEESLVFLYQPKEKFTGCGIMLNHQLYRGSTLFAGEVGKLADCHEEEAKNREQAKQILVRQITAIVCVLNPEKLVIDSKFSFTERELYDALIEYIELYHLPKITIVENHDTYVFQGLMEAAIDQKRNPIKVEEVRKV